MLPEYRITLFFGPEASPDPPHDRHCVFNVKKRSWKGGIQMDVWISEAQTAACAERLEFASWLRDLLRHVPAAEAARFRERAHEALVQQLCLAKLNLAIAVGLPSRNARLEPEAHAQELSDLLPGRARHVRQNILSDLDLPDGEPAEGSMGNS